MKGSILISVEHNFYSLKKSVENNYSLHFTSIVTFEKFSFYKLFATFKSFISINYLFDNFVLLLI